MFFLELEPVICGDNLEIPGIVGRLITLVYMAIRIGIPIILLIVGMIDLGKAVVAQKEDEIKKTQGLLIKKVIAAVLVFLLFTLIQFAINLVDNDTTDIWTCVDKLIGYDGKEVSNSAEDANNGNRQSGPTR